MAIEITEANFHTEVMERSREIPVLVDFWADWCQPCKTLGPLLEEMETAFEGRFLLATVNTQTETQLTSRFGISSIPHVKLIYREKILDEFTGALAPEELKQFLNRNIPDSRIKDILAVEQKEGSAAASQRIVEEKIIGQDAFDIVWRGVLEKFLEVYHAASPSADQANPENTKGGQENMRHHLQEATRFLQYIPAYGHDKSQPAHIILEAIRSQTPERLANMGQALTPNGRIALDETLDLIENAGAASDKQTSSKEQFKKWMVAVFTLLGDTPITMEYRKKLSRLLF